jgi:hypothetical protein
MTLVSNNNQGGVKAPRNNKENTMLTCQTAQMLESMAEEKKINAIGFTKNGRQILNDQEYIFVDSLVDCEKTIYDELSTEAKLEIWKAKHNADKQYNGVYHG